jgi:hypothetical protein
MKYFYAWGLLFVIPFTIYAYWKSTKEVRKKMIISGIGFGIISVIISHIFTGYWSPKYLINNFHLEDFLYGFLFAGILPAMHNIFRNVKTKKKYDLDVELTIAYFLIMLIVFFLMVYMFKINYIYALCLTPLIIGILSYMKIQGNLKDVLITVGCSLFITVIVYNIILLIYPGLTDMHFIAENVSSIRLLRVPLEVWLFAICLGVGATYTHEAVFNVD